MNKIILFDGECNFCDQSVQFIIKRDPAGYYKFASLQSDIGQKILKEYSVPDDISSFILIDNNRYYSKSSAALRVCKHCCLEICQPTLIDVQLTEIYSCPHLFLLLLLQRCVCPHRESYREATWISLWKIVQKYYDTRKQRRQSPAAFGCSSHLLSFSATLRLKILNQLIQCSLFYPRHIRP